MGWVTTDKLDDFLRAADEHLLARPAENTVLLTAAETLRARGPSAFGQQAPLFGWWELPGGTVKGAFLHMPPDPVVLTRLPPEAAAALATTLARGGRTVPGVNASREAADAFAATWRNRTGDVTHVRQHTRLYRLATLMPLRKADGGPRVATTADRDLTLSWFEAFAREVGEMSGFHATAVDDLLGYGGLTFWEADGVPVSMGGASRPVARMVWVGPVYTPPSLRRHGYGGSLAVAMSRAALEAGASEVLMFTDVGNSVSAALYMRMGYQPVADRVVLTFTPAPVPAPVPGGSAARESESRGAPSANGSSGRKGDK
jgi:GNAT superfamily N-acetyltransferase